MFPCILQATFALSPKSLQENPIPFDHIRKVPARPRSPKTRFRRRVPMMAAICLTALLPLNASAAVLDDVRNTGVFKIGYRADAAPYSSVDPRGAISGYSIGLCRRIAEAVRKHLNLKT